MPAGSVAKGPTTYLGLSPGYYVGLYVQRLRMEVGSTALTMFTNVSLFPDDIGMLNTYAIRQGISSSWPNKDLHESIEYIRTEVASYIERMRPLRAFSDASLQRFQKFDGVRDLYNLQCARYLGSGPQRLPIEPDRQRLIDQLVPDLPYKFDLIDRIVLLENEMQSSEHQAMKRARIQTWLVAKKLPSDFFDHCSDA
ncbi:MAG: hypothetical protein GC165_14595 [Armatimonadetes bacterium]|nr:hypothetical protein [Armatimonadota bacterium]MBS1725699.1 hypothetical protein [Armatimonadota bacterium]